MDNRRYSCWKKLIGIQPWVKKFKNNEKYDEIKKDQKICKRKWDSVEHWHLRKLKKQKLISVEYWKQKHFLKDIKFFLFFLFFFFFFFFFCLADTGNLPAGKWGTNLIPHHFQPFIKHSNNYLQFSNCIWDLTHFLNQCTCNYHTDLVM